MLTIVTALPWEAERFVARLRGARRRALGEGWAVRGERQGVEVRVVMCGPGRERVKKAEAALTTLEPATTGLLSVGVCGGLEAGLRPGDLVVARHLRHVPSRGARAGAPIEADAELSQFAITALQRGKMRWREGDSATVDAPIGSGRAKADLRVMSHCVIAQMEDYYWAHRAAEMGVPFAAVRSVLDPVQRSVPEAVWQWDWRGPRAGEMARDIVREPLMIAALVRLAGERRQAKRAIDRFLEALVRRPPGSAS